MSETDAQLTPEQLLALLQAVQAGIAPPVSMPLPEALGETLMFFGGHVGQSAPVYIGKGGSRMEVTVFPGGGHVKMKFLDQAGSDSLVITFERFAEELQFLIAAYLDAAARRGLL